MAGGLMLGPSHRIAGCVAWVGAGPLLGVHSWPLAAGIVVAAASSHGRLSPDMDRYPILGRVIPGGHRGITHWWPLPLTMYAAGVYMQVRFGVPAWPMWAVAAAWASHIVTDGVFGRVPVWPERGGWRRAGVGLKTGGRIETGVAVPVFIAAGVWLTFRIAT